MSPILERLIGLAFGVLCRSLGLLSHVPLAVRDHLAHMSDVVFLVLVWVLLGVLLEDRYNLPSTTSYQSRGTQRD